MSGYLEVKYPFKPNLGLNPFKSWKRQWCILRPSGSSAGGSLAVYCSEAGAAAGTVPLPAGGSVQRTKSRSRPHAFGVYPSEDRKPCVLLAAHTHQDAQAWMEKIKALIKGEHLIGLGLSHDSFSVTIIPTDLSRKCGLITDATASIAPSGLVITKAQKVGAVVDWKHVVGVKVDKADDKNQACVVTVDSEFRSGAGELCLCTPLASELCAALSRYDLTNEHVSEDVSRSSWSSVTSEVSLDDLALLNKERASSCDTLSRTHASHRQSASFDDSLTDRRSLLSIASGIYEEIPDLPGATPSDPDVYCHMDPSGGAAVPSDPDVYCRMDPSGGVVVPSDPDVYCRMDPSGGVVVPSEPPDIYCRMCPAGSEPMYESVDCVYATMRRRRLPPPLPPRTPCGILKTGELCHSGLNTDSGVIRHSSMGSLSLSSARTDPGQAVASQAHSVFRKRLKSDSRLVTSPKSDPAAKENKLSKGDTKKKKFDFQPTRDIFKNFKVSRKMKNLKITSLSKTETKSCEFLDSTDHVTTNRCSKSVECLEENVDEFDGDLSIQFNEDTLAALALPQEIVDIIVRGRQNKITLNQESHYLPMSPIVPVSISAPIEHHYTVMAPFSKVV